MKGFLFVKSKIFTGLAQQTLYSAMNRAIKRGTVYQKSIECSKEEKMSIF